jgi:uncharacterized protein YrrD
MLWKASGLKGFHVVATDGRVGKIKDVLVNDADWRIRWIVGDIGSWLDPHMVLLPPTAFGRPQEEAELCPVALSKDSITHSLDISEDPPFSMQMRHKNAIDLCGMEALSAMSIEGSGQVLVPFASPSPNADPVPHPSDPHLRSITEVTGYEVIAHNDAMGKIDDFIIDDVQWTVTNLVVRWTSWWKRHSVLVPTSSVRSIDWSDRSVRLSLSSGEIKSSLPSALVEIHGRHGGQTVHTGWESVM